MFLPALVVVDMQRYYVDAASDFSRFYGKSARAYLDRRLRTTIPACQALLGAFRAADLPVLYLRIASTREDRGDLHRYFAQGWREGREKGFAEVYPLADSPWADITPELAPQAGEPVLTKTGFSAFSSPSGFQETLTGLAVDTLVFCGLCTSQCVETTARDASDRGWKTVLVEDALADYSEDVHLASLAASAAVCGAAWADSQYLAADLLGGLTQALSNEPAD